MRRQRGNQVSPKGLPERPPIRTTPGKLPPPAAYVPSEHCPHCGGKLR